MTTSTSETSPRRALPPAAVPVLFWIYEMTTGLLSYVLFILLIYACVWSLTGKEALPPDCVLHKYPAYFRPWLVWREHKFECVGVCYGGNTLTIVIYYSFAILAGKLAELVQLPGLVGMLLSGLSLHYFATLNSLCTFTRPPVPVSNEAFFEYNIGELAVNRTKFSAYFFVSKPMSAKLRQVALATLLLRAGLSFDPAVVRVSAAGGVAQMAIIPCLTEAFSTTIICKNLLGWSCSWAAMLGFVMAAISPDVVVPNMMRLQEDGRGVNHGIPTMAMTACSMDDLVTITGFGLAFIFAFSNWNINDGCRAPSILMLRAIGGGVVGGFLGFILWFIPPPGMENEIMLRGCCVFLGALALISCSMAMDDPIAGVLGCILFILTVIAGWKRGWPWRMMPAWDSMRSSPSAPDQSGISSSGRCLTNALRFVNRWPCSWPWQLTRDPDALLLSDVRYRSAVSANAGGAANQDQKLHSAAPHQPGTNSRVPANTTRGTNDTSGCWPLLLIREPGQSAEPHSSDIRSRVSATALRVADGLQSLIRDPDQVLNSVGQRLSVIRSRVSANALRVTNSLQSLMRHRDHSTGPHQSDISRTAGSSRTVGGTSGAQGCWPMRLLRARDQTLHSAAAHRSNVGSGVSANSRAVSDADEMLLRPGAHTRPDVKSGASEQTEYQDPGRSRLRRVQGTDMTERHVSLEPEDNNSGRQSSNSSVAAWTHLLDESQANNNNNDRGSSRASSIVAAVATAAAATVALPAHREYGMVCIQMLHAFLDNLWWFMQPLLFSFLGASLPMLKKDIPEYRSAVGLGIRIVFCAVFIRLVATYVAVIFSQLNLRERMFVTMAWIPKATLQAIIGGLAFDVANKFSEEYLLLDIEKKGQTTQNILKEQAEQITIMAIVIILITAPLGAILMRVTAFWLLSQGPDNASRPPRNEDQSATNSVA